MYKKGGSSKRNNYIADKLLVKEITDLNSLVLCEVGRGTRGKIIFFTWKENNRYYFIILSKT